MLGYTFSKYIPVEKTGFDKLLDLFLQLSNITGGDVAEALSWMTELDRQYKLSDPSYGMGDFVDDLKDKGYIEQDNEQASTFNLTAKSEQDIRKSALEEIFGKLKKGNKGTHTTFHRSQIGGDPIGENRPYEFGDSLEHIDFNASIRNAQINHGINNPYLREEDLEVSSQEYKTQVSTVLMIDISHSMILYGEDRITPAKKVAMALTEMISRKYKKDTLDIIVFGNDSWQIDVKDLPYLKVGPYHTNTVAGLELAMDLLRKRKNSNKQIFMITDGKPTCIKEGLRYYKNSFGLDNKIINKTLNLAGQCRRLGIHITTFMIASDPYLQRFVQQFTQTNNGSAYYTQLEGLGSLIFEDYRRNRRKKY